MSSSSIDLGKSILAKLQQIQPPKKQNPKTNAGSKRAPPGAGPSSSSSLTKNRSSTDLGRSNTQKTSPRSSDVQKPDKSLSSRKNKKQQKRPSSEVKRDETQAKRPMTKLASPPPDDTSKDHQKSRSKSKQESVADQEEDNGEEDSEQDDSDDHEILLAEIKNLGGTEDDLDLFEGAPWKEAVIQEEDVVDDAQLVNDVKRFMKGLDFEAALKTLNDRESSPHHPTPSSSVDDSKTKTDDKNTTHPSASSSSSGVLKRKSSTTTTTTNQSSVEPPSNINKKKKKKGNK
ncbi:hypothetical protein PGTUg99_037088 [Puccinia graminis f. sp. tritici]|uniref:Uncharacterized protein n=1 Tax=Puccinia graminis f. sp. tritici TaxID=56615 RepID=A0A5B0SF27_PUCGR|nr:hypothetical protein PGTUg99_037088 [Puccinia graminis f. sp. tritici]